MFGTPWSSPEADPDELGGKGASLVAMAGMGLPVPPGFVISVSACRSYMRDGWSEEIRTAIHDGLDQLEAATGKVLGNADAPLLVSVRSGAAVSMPGMMDTILNAGMTAEVAEGLARSSGDPVFALDTLRRSLLGFAEIVGGADPRLLQNAPAGPTVPTIEDLGPHCTELTEFLINIGNSAPREPRLQIIEAVRAVFESWGSDRAITYREIEGIDNALGTAVSVQTMVFGNRGERSGTGVAFTRDPATGAPGLMGDFLVSAQGEDVVAGTHASRPLADMASLWPEQWEQLTQMSRTLEHQYQDMMDLEFTVEDGVLWMLQARRAKRAPAAVFRSAVDMAVDPDMTVDRAEAVRRCEHLMGTPPTITTSTDGSAAVVIGTGLAASPGIATGELCLDPDSAVERAARGVSVILVRQETSPADIHGMAASSGILTTLGGRVSHAAVVARDWGIPAVVGAAGVAFENDNAILVGGHRVEIGDVISIDGATGEILLGAHITAETPIPEFATIDAWSRQINAEAADAPDLPPPPPMTTPVLVSDVMRCIVLKGMTTAEMVATMTASDLQTVTGHLETLQRNEMVIAAGERFRPGEFARDLVHGAWVEEGADICDALNGILDTFHQPNMALKELMIDWQIRTIDGEEVPNDHSDVAWDRAVLDRLATIVHEPAVYLVQQLTELVPRLGVYLPRLQFALDQAVSGDTRFVAHPLIDSYHTAWFELHEELIHMCGRDRLTETEAGRA